MTGWVHRGTPWCEPAPPDPLAAACLRVKAALLIRWAHAGTW